MYDLDSLQGTSIPACPYSEYKQALEEYTFMYNISLHRLRVTDTVGYLSYMLYIQAQHSATFIETYHFSVRHGLQPSSLSTGQKNTLSASILNN